MSYSAIYAAFEDGDMIDQGHFGNGVLFTDVWEVICRRYLGSGFPWGGGPERKAELQKVWDLPYNPKIPITREHYYAQLATYDRMVADAKTALLVADGFDAIVKDVISHDNPNLWGQARFLRELAAKKPRAIGWYMTSCGDNLWWVADETDPAGEERRHYNIDRDKGHEYMKPYEERTHDQADR